MEAKTLPADVCVFGCFGWLSPVTVHSTDCWFDSDVKWWIHVSSIVTYSCKSPFCCVETVANNALNHQHVFDQTWHPLWTQLSHWQMFMQNEEYTAFLISSTSLLSHATSIYDWPKEVCGVFDVFRDNCQIWVTWLFIIICVYDRV